MSDGRTRTTPLLSAQTADFSVLFDARVANRTEQNPRGIVLPIACIGGERKEEIFPGARFEEERAGFRLYRSGDLVIGCCVEPSRPDLTAQAESVYRRLLEAAGDRYLCRIWNYVPAINSVAAGLENYRAFCRGRSLAFQHVFGSEFQARLPAASAVGGSDDRLAVIFVTTAHSPRHIENPEQVPAYRYPEEYGPLPPSFARATVLKDSTDAPNVIFVSGTASIKGHQTLAVGNLIGQIGYTLDNLRLVSIACGLTDFLGATGPWQRHFKVYLRHEHQLSAAAAELNRRLFAAGDRVTWLRSDICRADLDIEIEATLVGR